MKTSHIDWIEESQSKGVEKQVEAKNTSFGWIERKHLTNWIDWKTSHSV